LENDISKDIPKNGIENEEKPKDINEEKENRFRIKFGKSNIENSSITD